MRHYDSVPDVTELRPGDPREIAGYRVVSRLGAGGQGIVFLAVAPSGERVAIKQLRLEDDRTRQQFVKEVAAARRVAPFCTARVVDVQMDGPAPYVVSEYIDGPSLQQQIDRSGPMNGSALHWLAIGTITALAAIHQAGVVHRDFKPANVMLSSEGPRVIDFGIARDLSTETTVTSRIFGTPAYMAPEQLQASGVGPAADVFAWASVIVFAATGRAPFSAPHMMAVVYRITTGEADLTGVPGDLLRTLQRCLDKDPDRRPSAQQVLALLLGRPVPAHDMTDPTQVLAEATDIVHEAGPATAANSSPGQTLTPGPVASAPRPSPARPQPSAGDNRAINGVDRAADNAWWNAPPPVVPAAPTRTWGDGVIDPNRPPVPRSGGRTVAIVTVLLLLLLLLAGWWLNNHDSSGDPTSDRSTGVTPTGSPGKSSAPAIQPTPADSGGDNENSGPGNSDDQPDDRLVVPERFDGTWEGKGTQLNVRGRSTWTARIELEEGETSGTFALIDPDLNCSGPLTVQDVGIVTITLKSVMENDPNDKCVDAGTVKLTRFGSQLGFTWVNAADPGDRASGTMEES